MTDYNLFDCSVMGIADYFIYTKLIVPKWMNETEGKAYKIGFARAKAMCN